MYFPEWEIRIMPFFTLILSQISISSIDIVIDLYIVFHFLFNRKKMFQYNFYYKIIHLKKILLKNSIQ